MFAQIYGTDYLLNYQVKGVFRIAKDMSHLKSKQSKVTESSYIMLITTLLVWFLHNIIHIIQIK